MTTTSNTKKDDFLNLDALDAEANLAPFVIRVGGKKVEIPHASTMTVEQAERMDTGERRAVMVELIGEELTATIWRLKVGTLEKFINAWLVHGGTDLGEDAASADS